MPLGTEVDLGPGHIVLDEDPAPPPGNGHSGLPLLAQVCCGQTAGWIKMPLDREADVGPGDIVLHRDPAPPKGHSPQFSAHICCVQTAGWMKIPFGTERRYASAQATLC